MVTLINQDFQKNKVLYNQIASELTDKLGNSCPINHVGSTAIPNMVGKNIIDILIGAKDEEEFQQLLSTITNLGYFPSKNSRSDIYQFFASATGETGSGDVHIHLVIMKTERYDEFLILRDYLLSHPEEAEKYSNHKKEILNSNIVERKEYRATKSKFVSALIERAKNSLKNTNN